LVRQAPSEAAQTVAVGAPVDVDNGVTTTSQELQVPEASTTTELLPPSTSTTTRPRATSTTRPAAATTTTVAPTSSSTIEPAPVFFMDKTTSSVAAEEDGRVHFWGSDCPGGFAHIQYESGSLSGHMLEGDPINSDGTWRVSYRFSDMELGTWVLRAVCMDETQTHETVRYATQTITVLP
jgi:hypothetical protein